MIFKHHIKKLSDRKRNPKVHFLVNVKNCLFTLFCRPSRLSGLPNLLRCQGLEVRKYVCAPSALHLGQTRQLQNLGIIVIQNCLGQLSEAPSYI